MKEFLMIFRNDPAGVMNLSPEEMQAITQKWLEWIGSIAAQGKLADKGNRLVRSGKVVKPGNVVTDGPYAEIKEFVSGYTILKADSYDEAVEIAKGCPIYAVNGNVEVREIDVIVI